MSKLVDEHVQTTASKGKVSEGGVDSLTGTTTGALAGAVLGASGGPLGLLGGAIIGGAIGAFASAGPEHPFYPEPWLTRREELHQHAEAEGADGEVHEADQIGEPER